MCLLPQLGAGSLSEPPTDTSEHTHTGGMLARIRGMHIPRGRKQK